MLDVRRPAIRVTGRGRHLRARLRGDWERSPLDALRECCRASMAIDKAMAEAIQRARDSGTTWEEIARTLDAEPRVSDREALIAAMAERRRAVWDHLLPR